MKRKILRTFISSVIALLTLSTVTFATDVSIPVLDASQQAATELYSLGLFSGTGTDKQGNPIFELDRAPTRHEAVTMLVNLLGKNAEAKSGTWDIPFTDVADWAKPFVGYAYANGLTAGTSATTFGGNEKITASQYLTFVLKVLGYQAGTDFQWNKSWALSDQIGITNGQYSSGATSFLRGDVAIISRNALVANLKNNEALLLDLLIHSNAVSENAAKILPPHSHEWDSGITEIKATCGTAGVIVFNCKICNLSLRNAVPSLNHNYQVGRTEQATCLSNGYTTYVCTNCGDSYDTPIAALGHAINTSNVCTRCGTIVAPQLNMSSYDIEMSSSVGYMANYSVQHDDASEKFTLLFSLLDYNENEISAPAIVDIYIKNDDGEIVYRGVKQVSQSDFATWTTGYGHSFYAVGIDINDSEIMKGSDDCGVICFTVYNPDYFSFDETVLQIYYDLPKVDVSESCVLELPVTPQTINYYSISGKLMSSTTVTAIDYKFEERYDGRVTLHIYFSGHKDFDSEGANKSNYGHIGWKLYDEDGYVVDSGTNLTSKIAEGERFKNSESYAFNLLPGKYSLVIHDIGSKSESQSSTENNSSSQATSSSYNIHADSGISNPEMYHKLAYTIAKNHLKYPAMAREPSNKSVLIYYDNRNGTDVIVSGYIQGCNALGVYNDVSFIVSFHDGSYSDYTCYMND